MIRSAAYVPLCASALPQELNITRAQLSRLAKIFRCRCLPRFFGRLSGQPHGSGARPPSHRAALGKDPYFKGLRAGGLGSLIWQPPPPPTPRSARRARPAQAARSPTSPCQGGTERAGACGDLDESEHRNLHESSRWLGPSSTGPRRRGRVTSTSRRAPRRHAADGAAARRGRSKFTATVASFLLLVPSQTSRESLKEGGSANPTGRP